MDRFRFLFFVVLLLQPFIVSSQTYWKIENEHEDEILLTVEVNTAKNTFVAFSRKDALKELAGTFTYALAKAAGKLKYPEIVFIEGSTRSVKDTLLLSGTFNYFDKQFPFSASLAGAQFNGRYLDPKGKSHPLTGVKMADFKPINDYPSLINTAFQVTEKSLINPAWLRSDEWLEFKNKVISLKFKISDDYELAATFFWLGKRLPFSPYELNKSRPHNKPNNRKNRALLREQNSSVALIEGNSLPSTQNEMDSIAMLISTKRYAKLVIDLRGNSRISPASANVLLNYICDKPFLAGAYLTRKWHDAGFVIPKSENYKKVFKSFIDTDFSSELFNKEQGRYLDVIPSKKCFKGKVYLLTDSKTARVAEMITYAVKNNKIGTIVGQKTAGQTFYAEYFKINGEYDLLLPDSEFFTGEGKSLNSIGVDADIIRSGDEVMKYVLTSN
jgi:Peptidase family S41